MRVLALDTTTRAGSVAVLDGEQVLVDRVGDGSRTHAERLPADIVDALAEVGWSVADIDLFAVASGPGSFTGLRIGIAAIQGLAFVHGRRIAPISALRALAEAAAIDAAAGTRVGAWMDAHRKDVFSALYDVRGVASGVRELVEIEGATVGSPASTIERWDRLGRPDAVCGDGAVTYGSLLPDAVRVVPPPALAPIIGRLGMALAEAGETVGPAGVQPLYVRRPDAELAREAASTKR